MVYKWLTFVQRALYPPLCRLCGAPGAGGRDLCAGCTRDLPRFGDGCRVCARPLAPGVALPLCGRCQRQAPFYDRTLAPFAYCAPLDHLIGRLKFHGDLAMASLLGDLLADRVLEGGRPLPDAILPVPLHPRRLRERGFNQAVELARPLARRAGLPVELTAVRRARATESQAQLPAGRRRANLRGAFEVGGALPYRHVAILDDVMTTGSTVDELARVLKSAGVWRVDVWVVARAL